MGTLGSIQTHINYLREGSQRLEARIDAVAKDNSADLREKFAEIKEILKSHSDKLDAQKELISGLDRKDARAEGSFYTAKWFIAAVAAIIGFLLDKTHLLSR